MELERELVLLHFILLVGVKHFYPFVVVFCWYKYICFDEVFILGLVSTQLPHNLNATRVLFTIFKIDKKKEKKLYITSSLILLLVSIGDKLLALPLSIR